MEHESFLADPHLWVAVAFFGFIALVYKPVGRLLTKALDDRADTIRRELEEATRLREEAESVLRSCQKKEQESLKEAEEILAKAREDATRIRSDAETTLKATLDNRMKLAMEKIAQSEAKALQDVQNHVVDIAVSAARSIITEQLDKNTKEELVRFAVGDIERKVH